MYALRLILGVAIVSIQGLALTWAAFMSPVLATSEIEKDGNNYTEVITREISANVDAFVLAETRNGAIEVRSWEQPTVRIAATVKMQVRNNNGWFIFGGGSPFDTEEEALEYFEKLKLSFEEDDPKKVGVKAEFPKSQKNGVNFSVSYVINVPEKATLDLKTSNGAIHARDIGGDVLADTSNGPIDFKNVAGSAKAETSNGKVSCEGAEGNIELRTSNGAVELERSTPLEPDTKIVCRTSNGAIKVKLPDSSAFDLKAETSNGSIRSDFKLPIQGAERPIKKIDSAINGGGADIELRTSNGTITVSN